MNSENKNNWDEMICGLMEKAHRDPELKKKLLADPKKVVEEELGVSLSDKIKFKIHENTLDTINLVFPLDLNTLEISDDVLEKISGGGSGNGGGLLAGAKKLAEAAKNLAGRNEEKAFQAQVKEWQKTLKPADVAALVSANFPTNK